MMGTWGGGSEFLFLDLSGNNKGVSALSLLIKLYICLVWVLVSVLYYTITFFLNKKFTQYNSQDM